MGLEDKGTRCAAKVTCILRVIKPSEGTGSSVFDTPVEGGGDVPRGSREEPVVRRVAVLPDPLVTKAQFSAAL